MKVAVIGSGISGLTAAHVIARRGNEVTLYEKDGYFGGHSNTVTVAGERGEIGVDTGFIVHNRRTYPHLIRLFDELGVATQESDMSFGVRCDDCGLEYAGARGVRGMLATPSSLTKPSYLRMLTEVQQVPPARPPRAARSRRRPHVARRLPRRRWILRLLPRSLRAPADRRDLVVLTHPDVRVPGPLPDPLLRKPRHADRAPCAALADRDRRQPRLCAGDPRAAGCRRAGRDSGGVRAADGGRRRRRRRQRPRAAIQRRGDRHACRPGVAAARRSVGGGAGGAARFHYSANETVLHTTARSCPDRRARAHPGTTCSTHVPRRSLRCM